MSEGKIEPTDEELQQLESEEIEDDEELEAFLKEALDEPTQGDVDYLSLVDSEFDDPEEYIDGLET